MSLRPSVAEILADHVSFELESIDRMYLNLYVSRLQTERQVASYCRPRRSAQFAATSQPPPSTGCLPLTSLPSSLRPPLGDSSRVADLNSYNMYLSPKTVESHVRSIFIKLDLQPSDDDNRRVLAVLRYLRG